MGFLDRFRRGKKQKGVGEREADALEQCAQHAEAVKKEFLAIRSVFEELQHTQPEGPRASALEKIKDNLAERSLQMLRSITYDRRIDSFETFCNESMSMLENVSKLSPKQVYYMKHFFPGIVEQLTKISSSTATHIQAMQKILTTGDMAMIKELEQTRIAAEQYEKTIDELEQMKAKLLAAREEKRAAREQKKTDERGSLSSAAQDRAKDLTKTRDECQRTIATQLLSARRLIKKYAYQSNDKRAERLLEQPYDTFVRDATGVEHLFEIMLAEANAGKIDVEKTDRAAAEHVVAQLAALKQTQHDIETYDERIREQTAEAEKEAEERREHDRWLDDVKNAEAEYAVLENELRGTETKIEHYKTAQAAARTKIIELQNKLV